MKIAAWNIRFGGENHSDLAGAIAAHDPDVIVLSEHQREKSKPLVGMLQQRGWTSFQCSDTEGNRNGVAILSRREMTSAPSPFGEEPFSWWGVEGLIDGIAVIGVYAPLSSSWGSSPEIQREFWNRVHRVVESRRQTPVLLIGDFNTCARLTDGPNPQPCWDAFEHLSTLGWTDAWRAANPGENDFSWVQRRVEPPTFWRIDHAFTSPLLTPAARACEYSHLERETKLSDHAMLLLDLDLEPVSHT